VETSPEFVDRVSDRIAVWTICKANIGVECFEWRKFVEFAGSCSPIEQVRSSVFRGANWHKLSSDLLRVIRFSLRALQSCKQCFVITPVWRIDCKHGWFVSYYNYVCV